MIATAASVTILVLALVPAIAVLATPAARRELRTFPGLAVALALGSLTGLALVVAAAVWWPRLLPFAAVLAGAASIGAWWRARPGFGAAKGWPPGSLSVRASLLGVDDRSYFHDLAHRYGPVFKFSQYGRPVVGVVGFEPARELLHGQSDALAPAALAYSRLLPKGMLRYMTAEDHHREAAVFRAAFGGVDLERAEAEIRAACRTVLDRVAASGDETGTALNPPLLEWACQALARLFFGVSGTDPRYRDVDAVRQRLSIDRLDRTGLRRLAAALDDGAALARDLAAHGDIGGSVLGGIRAADPDALSDPTQTGNLWLIFRLATGDLTGLLNWLVAMLADHPTWADRIRAEPRVAGPPTGSQPKDLASRVVLETVRLEQSEFLYRRLIKPARLGRYTIPAGWLVRICVQESHRDPAVFPDPERFDPDRFLHRRYSRSEYSPFGADNHGCLGATMVLFLGRILVEELCHGYACRVVADGPLERGSRLRHHWRPSARRRLVVTRLESASPS